jgi:hypothetical protein
MLVRFHVNAEMEGLMRAYKIAQVIAETSIHLENQELRMQKVVLATGRETLRISSVGDKGKSNNIAFNELELLELLHNAIHAGVLPREFIGKLRERIEI